MPLRLTRLQISDQIIAGASTPTQQFLRYFNKALEKIEDAINGLAEAVTRLTTAEGDINTLETSKADAGAIGSSGLTMATGKVLGRNDASTGPIEELTLSEVLNLVGSAAQGDILYRDTDGNGWKRLGAGTSGQLLQTQGASANPIWASVTTSFRGALVTKAADQTAANYTTRAAIAWDSEAYDTDSIHDNVTNNSRLTVPSGVTYVRCTGQVRLTLVTSGVYCNLMIKKNGAEVVGSPGVLLTTNAVGQNWMNVVTPVMAVSSGDYFTLDLEIQTDTSVTVFATTSWFGMQIIA